MNNVEITEADKACAAKVGMAMYEYVEFLAAVMKSGVGLEPDEGIRRKVANDIEFAIAEHRVNSIAAICDRAKQ